MDIAQISWVDMLLLAVLAVSVIVGLMRGFGVRGAVAGGLDRRLVRRAVVRGAMAAFRSVCRSALNPNAAFAVAFVACADRLGHRRG